MNFEGRVEVSPGRHLWLRDEGDGEPVLLLHGFTGSGASMASVARELPAGFRVLAVDLLGHGRSDAPKDPGPYRMEACVQDLGSLLTARGVGSAHLVGYSMGARIALGLAVLAADRVRSLALVGARAGIADEAERVARVRADESLAHDIESRGLDWFVDHWMGLPLFASQARLGEKALAEARAARLRNRPEGLAASLRGIGAGAQPPLFAKLASVVQPTLLVTGSEDPRFGAVARDLAEALPDAVAVTVPDAGHAAHLEQPARFAELLGDFLAQQKGLAVPMPPGPAIEPGSAQAWLAAARPATLPASLVPVAVGSGVAAAEGAGRLLPALACLGVAVSLQLATNFVNDYADFERGADDEERLGPPRTAQQGWLTVSALRVAALLALGVAAILGLYGAALGGWPIVAGGVLALVCAWAYTGGPFPLGYHGLGDVLVFGFFGMFAVVGTHWVQAGETSAGVWASAVPIGALATALIAVNNLRDRPKDVQVGKRTMAVRLGPRGARHYTAGLVGAAYLALGGVAISGAGAWAAVPALTLPLAFPILRSIRSDEGVRLNATLARTGKLELAFGVALCIAWAAAAWIG